MAMLLEVGVEPVAGSLPLERLPFSRRDATISSCGMAPGSEHHEPKTVAVRTDSSERECRIFDNPRAERPVQHQLKWLPNDKSFFHEQ
jgi:hypothetical protein